VREVPTLQSACRLGLLYQEAVVVVLGPISKRYFEKYISFNRHAAGSASSMKEL
jgi:hypothetical protein